MSDSLETNKKTKVYEEITPRAGSGMLILNILFMIATGVGFVFSATMIENGINKALWIVLLVLCLIYFFIVGPILFAGLKILKPKEALVLTLFGKYYGSLKGEGFFFVNPFVSASNPAADTMNSGLSTGDKKAAGMNSIQVSVAAAASKKKISLKTMTLNNEKQKINDLLGNPIIIGIVVMWRVVNTAKAAFNVDNYMEYLSIQCDSALRNIVRFYPYDVSDNNDNEKTLRGSSMEIAAKLKQEIQSRVDIAGLEILELE